MAPDQRTGRRLLGWEIALVLAVSLGMSGLYAVLDLIGRLTVSVPLSQQQAVLNGATTSRPWLELGYQILGLAAGIAPAFLALYLLARSAQPPATIGVDRSRPRGDALRGLGLAAVIGLPGLGLYLAAHALGISASIVAEDLPNVWWRYPILVLSAVQNAGLEEIVVVGYLLTRLGDLGWRPSRALAASSVLRGSYHLYQGFGGFLGNLVMGLIFGYFFQRTRRVLPLVIAHSIIDTVSFVGYAALAGHVSWIPT